MPLFLLFEKGSKHKASAGQCLFYISINKATTLLLALFNAHPHKGLEIKQELSKKHEIKGPLWFKAPKGAMIQ